MSFFKLPLFFYSRLFLRQNFKVYFGGFQPFTSGTSPVEVHGPSLPPLFERRNDFLSQTFPGFQFCYRIHFISHTQLNSTFVFSIEHTDSNRLKKWKIKSRWPFGGSYIALCFAWGNNSHSRQLGRRCTMPWNRLGTSRKFKFRFLENENFSHTIGSLAKNPLQNTIKCFFEMLIKDCI